MEFTPLEEDEDMIDVLERAEAAADRLVRPWQARLGRGDFYVQYVPQMDLVIYGEILRREGGNRRSVRAYSVACTYGEYGGLHVSQVSAPLSRAQFIRAKDLEWPSDREGFLQVIEGDPRFPDEFPLPDW